jgi:hypothetical protein
MCLMNFIKSRIKPNLTLKLATQFAMQTTSWWSKLGPELGKSSHLRVCLERHVNCPHIKNWPIFSFVYLSSSSGVIFHWTLQLCTMPVNWSTGYLTTFPSTWFQNKLAGSSCRRRVCFQNTPEFSVPSTQPPPVTTHQILKGSENRPFSYT